MLAAPKWIQVLLADVKRPQRDYLVLHSRSLLRSEPLRVRTPVLQPQQRQPQLTLLRLQSAVKLEESCLARH